MGGEGSGVDSAAAEFLAAYGEYAKALRTWLFAYGIGGPLLILGNEHIWEKVAVAGVGASVGWLFLSGVGLQVVLVMVNKTMMWINYYGEIESDFARSRFDRIADWVSRQFWIDFCGDLASIALFGTATMLVFRAVA